MSCKCSTCYKCGFKQENMLLVQLDNGTFIKVCRDCERISNVEKA